MSSGLMPVVLLHLSETEVPEPAGEAEPASGGTFGERVLLLGGHADHHDGFLASDLRLAAFHDCYCTASRFLLSSGF